MGEWVTPCKTCRYFVAYGNAYGDGECRRHAPTRGTHGMSVWPRVGEHQSCGDHAPIPPKEADRGE